MTLAITATLAGSASPQVVQVVVTGLTAGVAFTVSGSTADGWAWTVAGGNGQDAGATTAILADIAAPVGVELTYTAEQSGSSAAAAPVTVPLAGDIDVVLQSLNGAVSVAALWDDNADPREQPTRQVMFRIPGREHPVVRWDTSGSDEGQMVLETSASTTTDLRQLVRVGAPVVVRTNGQVRDVDPVQFVIITKAPRVLVGAAGGLRRWSLGFTVIANPEPSLALAASDGDDFDAAYATLTWTDFDAEWASLTGDNFDATDWSAH